MSVNPIQANVFEIPSTPAKSSSSNSAALEQAAKDFESVLLGKLLESMKDSIGDWGGMTDGVGKQVQDLFWQYLAKDLGNRGGLGRWKDIQRSMAPGAYAQAVPGAADGRRCTAKGAEHQALRSGAGGAAEAAK